MCCHLCRLEVTPGEAHDDTPMHRAAQLIAVTALDRLRAQAFPDTEGTGVFVFDVPSAPNPEPTQPQAFTTTFSIGGADSQTQEPRLFATNASEDCATTNTNTPSVEPFSMPVVVPSVKAPVFGATVGFAFGAFGGTSTSTTGGTTTGSTLFGAAPATGSLFGQQPAIGGTSSLFGNTSDICGTTTGSILFGAAPATGSLFGQQPAMGGTSSLFGNTSGGEPQIPGTAHVKYDPVIDTEEVVKSGVIKSINVKYQFITGMKYENKAIEELRWEDYSNRNVKDGFRVPRQLHDFGVFGRFSATDFAWCDYCQQLVSARAHVTHQRSKLHIEAAYHDQMFKEAVRGYVDKEHLKILEGPSTDDVDVDPFISGSKLDKVYNCSICEMRFVPVEFKKQHKDSIRHCACLALAAAACRRLRRHLAGGPARGPGASGDTPGAPDAPADTMRDLLYAYRYPQIRIKDAELSDQSKLSFRLLLKKYISRICARLKRIATAEAQESYTMIVTDDTVIIKSPIAMAVDWLWYVGVKYGERHKKYYTGIGKFIEGHLETPEYVQYVLSPIDEQGVRQIDYNDSICLLCGDKVWSFDASAHTKEERHIKNRAIALNRGKMYTETKEDLKLHLTLKAGTIKIVSEDSVGIKQDESEDVHEGFDKKNLDNQVEIVNPEINGGDHASPSDAAKHSDITE